MLKLCLELKAERVMDKEEEEIFRGLGEAKKNERIEDLKQEFIKMFKNEGATNVEVNIEIEEEVVNE